MAQKKVARAQLRASDTRARAKVQGKTAIVEEPVGLQDLRDEAETINEALAKAQNAVQELRFAEQQNWRNEAFIDAIESLRTISVYTSAIVSDARRALARNAEVRS